MDTQLTGSERRSCELFRLDAADGSFSFTVKGRPVEAKVQDSSDMSSITVHSGDGFSASVCASADCAWFLRPYSSGSPLHPLFFEWEEYELILISNDGNDYTVSINGECCVTSLGRKNGHEVSTGVLNFRDSIGFSDIRIMRSGVRAAVVTIEVYPRKMSYKKDYEVLKKDVSDILYNLIYSILEKTFTRAGLNDSTRPSQTETFSILRAVYSRFKSALDLITEKPHHKLITENVPVRADRIKRSSGATVKWIEKHPESVKLVDGRIVDAGKLIAPHKIVVFDTRENRYAKHIVIATLNLVSGLTDKWQEYISRTKKDSGGEYLEMLNGMKSRLRMTLETSFLRNVGEEHTFESMSLVYSMAPGYKDLYKYWLMLRMGLSENMKIDEMLFDISLKGLSRLYEYWCFVKLNSIISSRYDMYTKDDVKIDTSGLFYELMKGSRASRIRYKTRDGSIDMCLEYNPQTVSSSVKQIPDNVFRLTRYEHGSGNLKWEFIFDAKYRISRCPSGNFTYKAEDEDINVMHRYRDALLFSRSGNAASGQRQRKVVGAFVLYPYPDSELAYAGKGKDPETGLPVKAHPNYSSIFEQNIGAFPFLPGHTELLSRFLDQIVVESPLETLSRTPLPAGFDYMMMYSNLFTGQDLLVVIIGELTAAEDCGLFRYVPGDGVYLSPDSEFLQKHSSNRFTGYMAVSASSGEYVSGNISSCILMEKEGVETVHFRFGHDTEQGHLLKRGRKAHCQIFASSRMVLSCSETIGELRRNSLQEYKMNYAKRKLQQGLFKDSYEVPDYFGGQDEPNSLQKWPLIVYSDDKAAVTDE